MPVRIILFIFSLSFFNTASHAEIPSVEHQKVIDELLEQNDAKKLVGMIAQKLSYEILESAQSSSHSTPSTDFIKLIQHETETAVYEDFVLSNSFNNIFYELYDEYFTLEELKEIVAFQASEAGQKLKQYLPHINERSFQLAKEQAASTGKKIHERLIGQLNKAEKEIDKLKSDE